MGNEVLVIVGFILVMLVGWLVLRKRSPSPIVKLDYDERNEPTLDEQRQLEDDMMRDGVGHHHRYPRH